MEDRAAAATQPPQLMRDWTQLDNDPSSSIVEAARLSLKTKLQYYSLEERTGSRDC